jgi:hypothetical protein
MLTPKTRSAPSSRSSRCLGCRRSGPETHQTPMWVSSRITGWRPSPRRQQAPTAHGTRGPTVVSLQCACAPPVLKDLRCDVSRDAWPAPVKRLNSAFGIFRVFRRGFECDRRFTRLVRIGGRKGCCQTTSTNDRRSSAAELFPADDPLLIPPAMLKRTKPVRSAPNRLSISALGLRRICRIWRRENRRPGRGRWGP